MYIDAFTKHFSEVEDSRQSAKVTYPLFDVLFVTLCSVIAGAEEWSDIQEYAEGHHDWFKKHGFLKDGVPVDDTIARIIARIQPEQFSRCFIGWMQAVNKLTKGELVAIDGKVLRGSYDREDRRSTIHMVNAYASANQVVIGQVKTDKKSNEITAIPELINLLELKGALVSIDAMGCQTDIATAIVKQDADYLLAVKGNQGNLHKAVRSALADAVAAVPEREQVAIEKKHGRCEIRHYHIVKADALAAEFPEWPKLSTIGVAASYRQEKGSSPTVEYRYYISSAALSEQAFADAVRSHWGIENSLHWVLDTTMKEDNCQIYRDNAAQNWSSLRQMSLNMLRSEKTKISIRKKQKRAWMKTAFLEQVLAAGFSSMNKN